MTTEMFWNRVLDLKDNAQECSYFIMDELDQMSGDPEQLKEIFRTAQDHYDKLSTASMRALLVMSCWNKKFTTNHDELYSMIYSRMVELRGEAIANRLLELLR